MSLTPEQKDKLLLAIERAEGQSECQYYSNDDRSKPMCVVGQLIEIEKPGFGLELRSAANKQGVYLLSDYHPEVEQILFPYGFRLLSELQSLWDNPAIVDDLGDIVHTMSEDEAKTAMFYLVERGLSTLEQEV
jgi:hypothetical protein